MKILEHNVETNEAIEREATPQEIAEIQAMAKDSVDRRANEEDAAIAKAALLVKLGITADEAKLLLA
jgi:hypothetical protein